MIYAKGVASVPTLPFNRYRQASTDSIVYNVVKLDVGWKIEATVPRHVSARDRNTVVNWFQEYRSQVRRLHPLWVTTFRSVEHGYTLDVRPVKDPKELLEQGRNLQGIWTDEIANRAR
jgi:hypothetical protein